MTACRPSSPTSTSGPGTLPTVTSFLTGANEKLLRLGHDASQASWVQETCITQDTDAIAARASEAYTAAATSYAKHAARFAATDGNEKERRQLAVLKNTITVAAPAGHNCS
jgi:peptidyl-dipeptidase A